MTGLLRVGLVQADTVWEDAAANRLAIDRMTAGFDGAVDVVVLPEMFATGFSMQPERLAEPPLGPTMQWMQQLARRLDAAVVGSVITCVDGLHYNRLCWVTPDGLLGQYDKRHLFRMGGEDRHYASGREPLVIAWRGFRIAPLVCYDLRFPVWSRRREGYDYDALLYIASWPAPRRHAWRSLLVARAIENQAYLIGVNRVGADGNGLLHAGDSVVHDFLGQPLVELDDRAGVATASLDLAALQAFRQRFPAQRDADGFTLHP
jgi:predicted amidohydrolase